MTEPERISNLATVKLPGRVVSYVIDMPLFRYVRALGAFYMRLTGTAPDCYKYLELLYNDYRKMKRKTRTGRE
jgi:pre-mRNA-splicing factor 38A